MTGQHAVLSRWNGWANRRLYAACAELSEEEYLRPRPCAFGSIHGTLNHILVADRIWLGRFVGIDAGIPALDTILHADFAGLRAARAAEDDRLIQVIADLLDNRDIDADFDYRSMDGSPQRMPLGLMMTHLFTHQAHHRGQVHALLSQTAVKPPSLDLTYYLRERQKGI